MLISFMDESGGVCTGHFVSHETTGSDRYLVVLERPQGGRFRTYVKPELFRAAMSEALEQLNAQKKNLAPVVKAEQNPPLDPKPWVAWGVRYPTQRGSAYFEPGPEYSQDRTQYDMKEA